MAFLLLAWLVSFAVLGAKPVAHADLRLQDARAASSDATNDTITVIRDEDGKRIGTAHTFQTENGTMTVVRDKHRKRLGSQHTLTDSGDSNLTVTVIRDAQGKRQGSAVSLNVGNGTITSVRDIGGTITYHDATGSLLTFAEAGRQGISTNVFHTCAP